VDEYLTDEQQADRAKAWLRGNGLFLVAGVVLGLGVLFGWERWDVYQQQQSSEASVVWGQVQSAIAGERFNEVDQSLELLETEYASTPYLEQARFAVARMHMDRNSPDKAVEILSSIVSGAADMELRRIAELRIAQIYLYQERYSEALALLGSTEASAFLAQYHELRGDIFFAQEQLEDARDEYQLALENDDYGTIDRGYVQMKLDDVTGSITVMAVEQVTETAVVTEPSEAGE
jgi:predicted negative regulator of RcsB-dependent stress response